MLTVLEIVGLKSAREEDKAVALQLLTTIASKGRQYKELLCESYGELNFAKVFCFVILLVVLFKKKLCFA